MVKQILRKFFRKIAIYLLDISEGRIINYASDKSKISRKSELFDVVINGDVQIGDYCKIFEARLRGSITIGRNCSLFGPGITIYSGINHIQIGNFCSIARNVTIQEFNHRYDKITSYFILKNIFGEEEKKDIISKGSIEIGNDVWIGADCIILSGTKIGDGVVIAANSVVRGNIPDFAVVGGSPANIIKYRFSREIIDSLKQIKWWDWTHEKIKRNKFLFETTLTLENLSLIKE